ncbi:hypothetical protein ACIBCT_35075 [Streptosporangium sp. NPDC050855]|uniref:hypothetical protein n=1 Tax=Streptosporangium sp. NPDC050855 TaxID=3366194 RepID=UPI0037AAA39A
MDRRFCRYLDEKEHRICGRILPATRNPLRLISARLGQVSRMDLCDEHEQAFLQLIEPFVGETNTGGPARDLAAKVELAIHTNSASGEGLDDASIRQGLRVLAKLNKLPEGFKITGRGKIRGEGVTLFLENRHELDNLTPEELAKLVEAAPSSED